MPGPVLVSVPRVSLRAKVMLLKDSESKELSWLVGSSPTGPRHSEKLSLFAAL